MQLIIHMYKLQIFLILRLSRMGANYCVSLTVKMFVVVLLRPETFLDDEGIRRRKISNSSGVKVAR